MCGITGFLDFNCRTEEFILRSMTDILHHRGPDDSGYYLDKTESVYIGLGHRRLSILDLSMQGHQPMHFRNLTIIFNGEIYNFKEIRAELEKKDYSFDSNTDTEVILKAYHCWGTDMISRFNGMFAFALYDKENQTVRLFRDRAGVKPLYYYFKNGLFLFASELKSFHQHPHFVKELDNDGLALYFKYGYIPQPYTIFNDCHKLKAGHSLSINLRNKNITDTKYWDVMDCYRQPKLQISEQEAIDETEKILKSAFEYRMVSDVPVGVFLSGGYDSTIVTAILQANRTEKIKTFTIGFREEKYNEAQEAKKIAEYLGTDHTEYYCTSQDAIDILPLIPEMWDEPAADSSAIPTLLVSRLARKQVTVALSADAGDETFGGYYKYNTVYKKYRALKSTPPLANRFYRWILRNPTTHFFADSVGMYNAKERLLRWSYMLGCDENEILSIDASRFTGNELKELVSFDYKIPPTDFDERLRGIWLDNLLSVDYKTYMVDDILMKVDRATMAVSLEGREPLLDHRIIEYVARLDPALKIKNGTKKYLLKQITHKYIPQDMMDRPKKGFGIPIDIWLRDELKQYIMQYLSVDKLKNEDIFNTESVIQLRDDYISNKKANFTRLWVVLMFQMWKEKWLG
ncbi:asparagine synthase (glutamine-hydrolyzing) [Treponema primitia ZAS-2]|uniref:asparagine synthase (glutamine-hydrolyzing) n=1 Tax=Treponema primitia (strain ATCC BAA-887 / DSM 12427 / ZAS-2) TaxID=545694 RepID=F5YN40_TREPZ|nr:asparagine synthase (glutamine-hydrolyzing) [Treponema primitia]AEF84189.1 asparagine synthase (glutamine-hydrolyzing) [Treponema primitia ZAS-2]